MGLVFAFAENIEDVEGVVAAGKERLLADLKKRFAGIGSETSRLHFRPG